MYKVNLFLPDISYAKPRNSSGTRHHLFETYAKVFETSELAIFPVDGSRSLVARTLQNYFEIESATLNVVTQGYSVLSAYAAQKTKKEIHTLVHTWKVPGVSDGSHFSKIYDYCLANLIKRSLLTIVANKKQQRELQTIFPEACVHFAPVSVDSKFWTNEQVDMDLLQSYGLKKQEFLLTVGGNDRNEELGILVSDKLGMQYVRVTRNQVIVELIQRTEAKLGTENKTLILNNISDAELLSLYQNAFLVLLPTITRTNPAGLSALVEAMSAGGVVMVHENLAEGYVIDNWNGLTIDNYNVDYVVERISCSVTNRASISNNARQFAVDTLNSVVVAAGIRKCLNESRLL